MFLVSHRFKYHFPILNVSPSKLVLTISETSLRIPRKLFTVELVGQAESQRKSKSNGITTTSCPRQTRIRSKEKTLKKRNDPKKRLRSGKVKRTRQSEKLGHFQKPGRIGNESWRSRNGWIFNPLSISARSYRKQVRPGERTSILFSGTQRFPVSQLFVGPLSPWGPKGNFIGMILIRNSVEELGVKISAGKKHRAFVVDCRWRSWFLGISATTRIDLSLGTSFPRQTLRV